MIFSSHRWARAGQLIRAAVVAFGLSALAANAQVSDAAWSGTWVGTYSYLLPCGITNAGSITLTLSVTGGVVSGSGIENGVACYSGCQILGYGTFSGSVYGTVSGSTMNIAGSWVDTCDGQNYNMSFAGALSGGILAGSGNITLQKLGAANNCIVDANTVYQTIDGFGASSATEVPVTWTSAQADMFFSTNTGIGLSFLRSRIAPDGTTLESNIMQMAQARGARVWSAPWSPPANFKDSGSVDGGNFVSTYNQPYASQLADYVLNMKTKYQVNVYAVSVQNEPNFNTLNYESCIWTAQQFHDFVPFLYQALSNNGVGSTKVMIPEEANWDFSLSVNTMNDPTNASMVGILASHGYGNFPTEEYSGGKPLWETETSSFDTFDGSMNNGIFWANQIHAFLTIAQVSAFHYWWLIPQSTDNEGLTDISGNPAKRMYVLGQFSRFIRPGYNRIGAFNNGDASISSYKDPASGNFAIVAINPDVIPLTQVFNLTNFSTGAVLPWITSGTLSLSVQSAVFVTNASFSYVLPPQSVVTFVGQTNNLTITMQPQNQEVAAGDTATFSVSASGTQPLSYFWQQNGAYIAGATNATYFLTNVPVSDSGSQFSCMVSNAFGAITSAAATLTVANPLYCFHGFDGSNPCAAVVQAADGNLYGTAQSGGTYGVGTVFGLTTNGLLKTLVSFNNTNGATPLAGLVQGADGNLYGTTEFGGAYGLGTIFKMTTNGQLTTLVSFNNATGDNPSAGLVQGSDGNFYGTTAQNAFSMTTNGTLSTLVSFNSLVTGTSPRGSLVQGGDGNFYGATSGGGNYTNGTVFGMTANGALTSLASFNSAVTGAGPCGGLVQAGNGNFYGTTSGGGTYNDGTVFKMTTNGVLTVLVSFNPLIGSQPYAGLVQANNGNFYGTTSAGGGYGNGTIFGMDTNGGAATLFSFDGAGGADPQAAPVQGNDGGFYGTTVYGGIGWNGTAGTGNGTVFRLPFPSGPAISTQPLSQPVGVGGTATFTIDVIGSAPFQYFWLRNGSVIAGATNATLILTNVATHNLGNYEIVITNSFGSVTSAVVTLTITNSVCVEPPPGIVSWWPGQSNAVDVVGKNNGTLVNGAGCTNAFVGDGFAFDGGSGYVQIPPNLIPLPGANPFSIELWFETATGGVILERQNGVPFSGVPNGWVPMMYVGLDGSLYVQLFWNGAFDQISTSTPVNDAAFHHLAVTYDGNNEAVYLDGAEIGAELLPYSTYGNGFSCQLGTGYTQGWPAASNGWYSFNGIIDEVALYSNALSPAQILSIYNAGSAGKCTDELLPLITLQPTNQTVLAGTTATFTVAAVSLSPLSYQWFEGATNIAGATNAIFTLRNVSTQNVDNYHAIISNSFGSVSSSIVTLTVTNAVCTEPPPGLMAWWPGQSNALDIVGGNNGLLSGAAGFANGLVGDGFAFSGGTGWVQLPQNLFPPPNANPFSIELWFETTSGGVILEQQNGAPFVGVPNGWVPDLYVGTDGNLYAQLFWDGAFNQISTGTPVNNGSFHHVAVTYDGNNEALYLDGAEIGSKPLAYSSYASNFSCQLGTGYIQGWPAGNGGWYSFNGIIDEPTLYSNALTAAQVLSIYNAGSAGKCTDELFHIVAQPTNETAVVGSAASFTINATSSTPLTYFWQKDNAAITGATNTTLILTNVTTQNAGNYTVVISSFFGSVTSAIATLTVVSAACIEPPPGLMAWWPGQSNALDIIGGNNGLLVGVAGFTNAQVGGGFAFSGGTGWVQLPQNLFPLPNASPFSIELWFETTTGGVILEQQNGAPFVGVPNGWVPDLYVGTDGNLYTQLFWDGAFNQISTGTPVNNGLFHHVAVTYDGNNETLYLDGAEIGSKSLAYSTYTTNFYCQLGTGYTQGWPAGNGGWYSFNGIIDEPTLYSNALTAAQVLSIYNAKSGGKCTDELLPVIVTQPTNQIIVAGGTAVFTVTATSPTSLSYRWSEGMTNLAGATNSTYAITNVPLSDSGAQFTCLVSNVSGGSNSSVAVLTVVPSILAITSVARLPQGNIQLTVTGLPGLEFRVWDSTNLINWQTIATLTNFTGTVQFTDTNTPNFNCRYYQLTTP